MNKTTVWIFAAMMVTPILPLAANDTDDAVNFAEKLNTFAMYDWSEEMLKKEIAKAPSDVDLLKVALASTYFNWNKEADGNQWIGQVLKTSRYYPDAQKTLGLVQFTKGRTDDAIKFLELYRDYYIKAYNEKLPTSEELERFERDVGLLVLIYSDVKPDKKKLVSVMRDVAGIKKKIRDAQIKSAGVLDDVSDVESPESTLFTLNVMLADILDADKKAGKALDPNEVKETIKGLESLYWGSPDIRDLAAMQVARCYTLAGDYKKAQQTFDSFRENIDVWETPSEDGSAAPYADNLGASPKASYRHYLGLLCKARAESEKDPAVQKKEYGKALNYLYACLKSNPGYPREESVLNDLLSVNETLQKITGKLPLALNNPVLAKVLASGAISDKAKTLFRDKKFDEAIPELLKGYYRAPLDVSAKEALFNLVECYMQTNSPLEAMVVADLIVQRWPKDDNVANVLLSVGSPEWKAANELKKDDPMRTIRQADAVRILNLFIKLFPSHQLGPDIAYTIARAELDNANAIMTVANATADPVEKLAKIDEGRAAYVDAAEKFDVVVKNFAQNKVRSNQALYLMGNCYSQADRFAESDTALRRFCEAETTDLDKLAIAKFMICDNAYREASNLDKAAKALTVKAGKLGEEDAAKATAEADAKLAKAKTLYLKAAAEYEDFVGEFYKNKLKETNEAKVKTRLASAKELVGWSFDGAGERDKAIEAFLAYLKSPYNNKTTEKRAPAVLSRIAVLYTEKNNARLAAQYLEELVTKYPKSTEGRDALFILGRSMYTIRDYKKSVEAFDRMFKEKKDRNIAAWTWVLSNMITYPNSDKPVTKEMASVAVEAGKKLMAAITQSLADKKNPDPTGWFADAAIKGFKKNAELTWDNLYMTQERIWLNYAKACYDAGLFKDGIEVLTKLIEPPRNQGLPRGAKKYLSPYYFDALLLRGDAFMKDGNENAAHKDIVELIQQATFLNRFDLQRKALCKDADLYIEAKKYKNALDVLEQIVGVANLKERSEVTIPAGTTDSVKEKIKQDAEERYQEELKYIEYAVARYAFCAAKLGLKAKADETVVRYKEAFGKGRYGRELERLPSPEAANQP